MVFRIPQGAEPNRADLDAQIDYRILRASVVARYSAGSIDRSEVCDAHPELIRAAQNVGVEKPGECPICEAETLVDVRYVFGPRLPSHGRCISLQAELNRFARRAGKHTLYTVEVCQSCNWNHLLRRAELRKPVSRHSEIRGL